MEILAWYKRLARALRWQILYEAYNGDIEKALSNCVALTKFGGHLQGNGLLIEQLVGIAIEGLANNVTFTLLDRVAVSADVLKNTQEELDKQFDTPKPVVSMEAEKMFWYDQIQRTFTDDGQGSGRMLARGMAYVVTNDWKDNLWRFISFNYPDRQKMMSKIDEYFERSAEILAETPWDLRDEAIDEQEEDEETRIAPIMLKITIPAHRRVSQIAWRMKTGRRALLAILAIMRYQKNTGQYPENLIELVSTGYLNSLPMDPFGGQPLIYHKTENGFIFYSLGIDFDDDGGRLGLDGWGKPRIWWDEGDAVFWPVP